jgi:hypothetical protein
MRNRKTAIALAFVLTIAMVSTIGCQKNVTPHPNQLSDLDGKVYDRLTEAQAALDEAKAQYSQGKLPPTAKDVINAGGAAYETARTSWMTYRDVLSGVKTGSVDAQQQQLNADMLAMAQAIAKVVALTGGN